MTRQITTFLLGDTLLGIDILLVKEVYRHKAMSLIPDAPAHLLGLMNLRGRVVTLIVFYISMHRPPRVRRDNCRLLILKTQEEIRKYADKEFLEDVRLGEDIVGFLIDEMDDVLTIENEEILPPPPHLVDIDGDFIEGVIKQGNRLIILLDVTAVLDIVMNASIERD